MRPLTDISNDGFYLKDVSTKYSHIAEFSLRSAFLSYFRTAEDLFKVVIESGRMASFSQTQKDALCTNNYALDACDAITHFQHFLELFLKDILLEDSPLLVYNAKDQNPILYKLVHAQEITESEFEKLKFIEFSEAWKRTKDLLSHFDTKYDFLNVTSDHFFELMERVNFLRNRIAHRGAFIIRPDALDELFCGYIIPFVQKIEANIDKYKDTLKIGLNLHTPEIKPYDMLATEYQSASVNKDKVFVLKLIASCAYKNEIPYFPPSESTDSDPIAMLFNNDMSWLYNDKKRVIEERAMAGADWGRLEICPVCGCNSFALEYDAYDVDEGVVPYVYNATCSHCGFHLQDDLLRPSSHGLPLQDYSAI